MTVTDEAVEAAAMALEKLSSRTVPMRRLAEAALEAASPHMLSAPEGVSEAEKRMGELIQVIDSGAIPGISTPVLREDLNNILLALSSERERAERAERVRDQWRTTSIAIATEDSEYVSRALVAEAKVKEAGEALRPFLALARAVTVDGSPDFVHWAREAKDWTVAFSFAGHSISLGDLRALAALRWTEEASQGEGE